MKSLIYFLLCGLFIFSIQDLTSRSALAQTTATVRILPATQTVTTGNPVTVTVELENVTNFAGFDVTLTYNPTTLQIPTGGVVIESAFLGRSLSPVGPIIDNSVGTVSFGAYSLGTAAGPNGNGRLASITFNSQNNGTSPLQLTYAYISHPDGSENPSTRVNGAITVNSISPTPRATPVATPRATPRATPAPSPTVPPGTATVILRVRFEGVASQRTLDRFIDVVVRQGSTVTTTQSVRVQSDPNGIYTNQTSDPVKLANIPVGTYEFLIDGPVHLARRFTNINLATGSNTVDLTTPLLTGDIQDNNSVDLGDYNRIVENFGCVTGQAPPPGKNCTPLDSDLDLDQDVDIFDYGFLVGNYSISGDQ